MSSAGEPVANARVHLQYVGDTFYMDQGGPKPPSEMIPFGAAVDHPHWRTRTALMAKTDGEGRFTIHAKANSNRYRVVVQHGIFGVARQEFQAGESDLQIIVNRD